MKNANKMQELILKEIQSVNTRVAEVASKLDEVRTTDIPNLKIDMAVVKEKTRTSARNIALIITFIGGIVTTVVNAAIGYFK